MTDTDKMWGAHNAIRHDIKKKSSKRQIAQLYNLAERHHWNATDWDEVRAAIIERWGYRGLSDIKGMASSGSCWSPIEGK